MTLNINYREAFFKGKNCFICGDYLTAKYWFNISMQDPRLRYVSFNYLFKIEIKHGMFKEARKMLNENVEVRGLKLLYGSLEKIENNYEQSKKYFYECMVSPDFQFKSLLGLAKLNIETGDYDISLKMIETLMQNPKYYVQSVLELVYLNILKHDFYEARRVLNSIDTSKLNARLSYHYKIIDIYIKYFLGELKMSDKDKLGDDYVIKRLFNHSDDLLLEHIDRHYSQNNRENLFCFLDLLDTRKLLYYVRNKIDSMNGNHSKLVDIYKFRLDSPIGYKGELVTSDLCVATVIGTKDIITMYPVLLSDEFDKEGFGMSEELKLKRLGVRK